MAAEVSDTINRARPTCSEGNLNTGNDKNVIEASLQEYQAVSEVMKQSTPFRILKRFVHNTLVPSLLIMSVPNIMILLCFTAVHLDGSFLRVSSHFKENGGLLRGMMNIWMRTTVLSQFSVCLLICFLFWGLLCTKFFSGAKVEGTLTKTGHLPVYVDNGFKCYLATLFMFVVLSAFLYAFGMRPTVVYDKFDEILSTLNIFSLVLVLFLYFKGIYFPSSQDCGKTGNFIFDYYWGTELYPRICGVDVKVFTNCRFGMTVWALLVCVFAMKSHELHGFVDSMCVTTVLQLLYITKFFWWESGYYKTIDIIVDRAGFYICWGCLVYIPGLYASVSLYLVNHPVHLGPVWSSALFGFGFLSLAVNYWADAQRQQVRQADGRCLVWGRKPHIIRAKYRLETGEEKTNILLASGWWGLSRHFHYIPELSLAFCWSATAGFSQLMPFLYFLWLVALLTHRSFRDDSKCRKKYGPFWTQYCERVPHRIIPFIF